MNDHDLDPLAMPRIPTREETRAMDYRRAPHIENPPERMAWITIVAERAAPPAHLAPYSHLRRAKDVVPFLHALLDRSPRECFVVIALDARHQPIGYEIVSQGTANSAIVHPREVFAGPLMLGAVAVIAAHNHPTGAVDPSTEDHALTRRLIDAGRLLGIPLLDHLIVGHTGDHYSFRSCMDFEK